MNERYYSLEIISERVSMSRSAVLRYTRLGMVAPRAWHGRSPLYGEQELARLRKIARLTRDLGLNLAGVEVVLRLTDQIDDLRRATDARRMEEL